MTHPIRHTAIRPFRISKTAVAAHHEHGSTPFLGCPLCVRRAPINALDIRWMSPRHG